MHQFARLGFDYWIDFPKDSSLTCQVSHLISIAYLKTIFALSAQQKNLSARPIWSPRANV